jgi:hypothetical protein
MHNALTPCREAHRRSDIQYVHSGIERIGCPLATLEWAPTTLSAIWCGRRARRLHHAVRRQFRDPLPDGAIVPDRADESRRVKKIV